VFNISALSKSEQFPTILKFYRDEDSIKLNDVVDIYGVLEYSLPEGKVNI